MRRTPSADRRRIVATAERFKAAWNEGARPRIEDFLAEVDESYWPPLLEELLVAERDLRERAGEQTSVEEYRRRFPACVPVVDSVFGLVVPAPSTTGCPPGAASDCASSRGAHSSGSSLPAELLDHPDYEIVRELGHGGMGVVYLAHNRLMGRDEVLKVIGKRIIDKPGVLDRFLREIRAVAKLRHPNIVSAYTAFRCGAGLVFSMEYVDGLDLRRMVKARGPLPVANACNYIHQAALGLSHAHAQGMVHRDIKPGNLMLSHEGNRALIKLLDFGLSKATSEQSAVELGMVEEIQEGELGEGLTRVGQMLGTPDFIAPEQAVDAQKADIRADIYSLGCTLYYLLNGQPPFQETMVGDVLEAHRSMEATPLNQVRADVPAELAALVAQMMAKDPRRRFQRPADVAEALTRFFKKKGAPPAGGATVGRTSAEQHEAALAAAAEYELLASPRPGEKWSGPASAGNVAGQPVAEAKHPAARRPKIDTPEAPSAPPRDGEPLPFYRSPAVMVATLLGTLIIAGGGLLTWYVGWRNASSETAEKAAADGNAALKGGARGAAMDGPEMLGAPTKPAPTPVPVMLNPGALRKVAPDIVEIGGVAVSVESGAVGPNDRHAGGDCLSLRLRITNRSDKPIRHRSWGRPGIAVTLCDQNGGYYNKKDEPEQDETPINPGSTHQETLVFEGTPPRATLYLDLPSSEGAQPFRFRIPSELVERRSAASAPANPRVAQPVRPKAQEKKPVPPSPPDPEKDPELRKKLISEYRAGKRAIERRALGMSTNRANDFRRTEPRNLRKHLAKEHNLDVDKVERIVGAE